MPQTLFCPLRKKWFVPKPEEMVRQALLEEMIMRQGYPHGNLAVEFALNRLPHLLSSVALPKRRADLIVFAKGLNPSYSFFPLLLIECKAVPLTTGVIRQVVGYNKYVKAFFIAVVNQTSVYTGCYHSAKGDYCFQNGLPPYADLIARAGDATSR